MLLTVVVAAQGLGTADEPPRLRDLEPLLVQLIYMIWALGGLLFTVLLIFIGVQYMASGGDPQKKEELKKKGRNWLIGLVLFFVGYPIVATIYDVLEVGVTNPECYQQVKTPGFHFFFPDVCTDPQKASTKYDINASCNPATGGVEPSELAANKCCFNTGAVTIVYPIDKWIGNTPGTLFRYERNARGYCASTSSADMCSTATSPTTCIPDYTISDSTTLEITPYTP